MTDAQTVQQIAMQNGWEFYPNYSGRGMMGNRCPAIACTKRDAARVKNAAWRAGIKATYASDNMGRDLIIYWPSIASQDPTL